MKFPFGWITLNCYTAASLNVPQKDLGVAIGLIGTFRSVGGSVGSVIFASIFEQTAVNEVAKRVGKTALNHGVPAASIPDVIEAVSLALVGVPDASATLSGVSPSAFDACIAAARNGYAYGFRITWLASIPFGVLATICAACVKDPSKYFTNHTEIKLNSKVGGKFEEGEEAGKGVDDATR